MVRNAPNNDEIGPFCVSFQAWRQGYRGKGTKTGIRPILPPAPAKPPGRLQILDSVILLRYYGRLFLEYPMTAPSILSQFSTTHEMLIQLLHSIPEVECYRSFHPELAPLAWYLGFSVYRETYWLREVVLGDDDLTGRIRELFSPSPPAAAEQWSQLPPLDHLLNWALELQDGNLTLLANPRLLPDHPLLRKDRLQHHLLQEHHRIFELMLMALSERQLQHRIDDGYRSASPLHSASPSSELIGIAQGHYRIGAKENPAAYDNELPPQMVELSGFRIAARPISNAEFLCFMEQDGYSERRFWSDAGWNWLQTTVAEHPHRWRRDKIGAWYGIGLNGPFDLAPGAPLQGVSQFETEAFAAWTASLGGELQGAVLQHEYQWEVAIRTQALSEFGQVWEWCSNTFHPYTGFQPSPDGLGGTGRFDSEQITLRGGSLHTQHSLRRPSFRHHALPDNNLLFAGGRLVFPPN